jgi:ADP-ribose pyrophosphatase YjhB (NUDIX family)
LLYPEATKRRSNQHCKYLEMTEDRRYPDRPIVGVGVVVRRDELFLLIRRGKPPREGQWSLPGGRQHAGETVEATARREVAEETGLELASCTLLTVVDLIERDETDRVKWHYTLVDFVAEAAAGEPVAGDDATDVGWFTLGEADELGLWAETLRILRMAATAPRSS